MRLLVALAAILGLIIGMAFWYNNSLQETTDELCRQIDSISREIEQEKWEAAVKQNEELEQIWQQKARRWPVYMDHQEIDNIEFSLARAKGYIICRDKALSIGQLLELKLMLQHIPAKEALKLENIF